MTIKQLILDYLRKSAYISEKQIVSHLVSINASKSKTPERSINRTLNALYKSGILSKITERKNNRYSLFVDDPQIKPTQEWYKKIYKTVIYCDGKKGKANRKSVFAYTYEQNTIDRSAELYDAVRLRYGNCYDIYSKDYVNNTTAINFLKSVDFGYMIELVSLPDAYIFPQINVGEE